MKVLIEVNLSTIEQGKSDLLVQEARDYLEQEQNIISQLLTEINTLNEKVSFIEEYLVL